MTKFSNVIVRRPAKSMVEGITSAPELGKPDYEKALKQHDDYIAALKECGVEVTVLPALEQFPDSCFVEDPAVITRCGAIITNPGADSRNGEKDEIEPAVRKFFDDEHVKHIVSPGTLDGGDVRWWATTSTWASPPARTKRASASSARSWKAGASRVPK